VCDYEALLIENGYNVTTNGGGTYNDGNNPNENASQNAFKDGQPTEAPTMAPTFEPFSCGNGGRRIHCNRGGFNVCSNGTPGQDLGCCPGYYYDPSCAAVNGKCCFPIEASRRELGEDGGFHPQDLLLEARAEHNRNLQNQGHLLSATESKGVHEQFIQAGVVMEGSNEEQRFLQEVEGGDKEFGVKAELVGFGGTTDDTNVIVSIIAGAVGGCAFVALLVAFFAIRRVRRSHDEEEEKEKGAAQQASSSSPIKTSSALSTSIATSDDSCV
jgi:hypothetical protein